MKAILGLRGYLVSVERKFSCHCCGLLDNSCAVSRTLVGTWCRDKVK